MVGCILALLALMLPRVVIVVLWVATTYISAAFITILWPLLGLIFMPYTTLAYAFAMNSNQGNVSGWYLVLVVVAVLVDIGSIGGGGASSKRR